MADLWNDGSVSHISQLTEEMIERGTDALRECQFGFCPKYIVEEVFRAMIAAHPGTEPQPEGVEMVVAAIRD